MYICVYETNAKIWYAKFSNLLPKYFKNIRNIYLHYLEDIVTTGLTPLQVANVQFPELTSAL